MQKWNEFQNMAAIFQNTTHDYFLEEEISQAVNPWPNQTHFLDYWFLTPSRLNSRFGNRLYGQTHQFRAWCRPCVTTLFTKSDFNACFTFSSTITLTRLLGLLLFLNTWAPLKTTDTFYFPLQLTEYSSCTSHIELPSFKRHCINEHAFIPRTNRIFHFKPLSLCLNMIHLIWEEVQAEHLTAQSEYFLFLWAYQATKNCDRAPVCFVLCCTCCLWISEQTTPKLRTNTNR